MLLLARGYDPQGESQQCSHSASMAGSGTRKYLTHHSIGLISGGE